MFETIKILIIIWVIALFIRVLTRNYLSNDVISNISYRFGIPTFVGFLYNISSLVVYVLAPIIVILIIIDM